MTPGPQEAVACCFQRLGVMAMGTDVTKPGPTQRTARWQTGDCLKPKLDTLHLAQRRNATIPL